MRNSIASLVLMLCTSCTLQPSEIQEAPLKGGQAVVFDIDGTLTPTVFAVSTPRDGAAKAVGLFADKGYKIIYLSARIKLLQSDIPNWLKKNHFPEGSIHVPQTAQDSSDYRAFKKQILEQYKKNGWKFAAAYGDSSTDFAAYSEVGIDLSRVFALRRAGEASCEPGSWSQCFDSWTEHMGSVEEVARPQ